MTPCLPDEYLEASASVSDSGITIFSYLISQWWVKDINDNDEFHFDLVSEISILERTVEDVRTTINILHRGDADTDEWFDDDDLKELVSDPEDGIVTTYVSVIC